MCTFCHHFHCAGYQIRFESAFLQSHQSSTFSRTANSVAMSFRSLITSNDCRLCAADGCGCDNRFGKATHRRQLFVAKEYNIQRQGAMKAATGETIYRSMHILFSFTLITYSMCFRLCDAAYGWDIFIAFCHCNRAKSCTVLCSGAR